MKRTKLFISLLFLLTSGFVSCSQNKIVTSSHSSSSSFSSEKFNSTSSSFIPKEKINAVIENMKSNFSFEFEDASSNFRFYIQQNIIHFFSSLEDEKGSYIELTNETAYLYVYKEDNNWYKSDILLLDYTSIVKEKISNAKWEDYNEETDTFFGTYENQEISAKIEKDSSLSILGQNLKLEVFNVNNTCVSLPNFENLIDQTNKE